MSMSVDVDVEALEVFSAKLTDFAERVKNIISTLQVDITELGEEWRGADYEEFKQDFEQGLTILRPFADEMPGLTNLLQRLIGAALAVHEGY